MGVLEGSVGRLLVCFDTCLEGAVVGGKDSLFEAVVDFGDQGLAKCWRVKVVML